MEARAAIEHECSAVQPTFTRTFGDILLTQAKVQSSDGAEIRSGLNDLLTLRERLDLDQFGFEREWIDLSLLDGYCRLGDREAATLVSARLMGQMVVRSALFEADNA